ncbi:DUF427 domain-containing protein [Actinocorallia sp. B10E7]|uniref:DUF427 domain-containing protein n=1 Tax=Actinocorallia sp. B10E7 TaxID=3153558 RepID=UPI00325E7DAA
MDEMRTERCGKRVRAFLGGEAVADSRRTLLVWERPYYPTYYFPEDDVRGDVLAARAVGLRRHDGHVAFDWGAVDSWFEEDEEVFTHARDPHKRVDVLAGSRHVVVAFEGVTLAESRSPRLLFETGLPARVYLPKTHVRMDLLKPSQTITHCPYKGQAEYWSLESSATSVPDVAWSYRAPFAESQKIAGLLCFYPDKVELQVDGERWT